MKDIKGLYLSQILVIVFSALTCISVFLPAATIYDKSVNLFMPGGEMGSGIFFDDSLQLFLSESSNNYGTPSKIGRAHV